MNELYIPKPDKGHLGPRSFVATPATRAPTTSLAASECLSVQESQLRDSRRSRQTIRDCQTNATLENPRKSRFGFRWGCAPLLRKNPRSMQSGRGREDIGPDDCRIS